MELIDKAIANKISFDWVGGDGLYGHNYGLGKELDERNLSFLLDVHKDQHIYEEVPEISVAAKKQGRGRAPTRKQSSATSIRVDKYAGSLGTGDWETFRIRKTTKGWLRASMHFKEVWVWDGKEANARKRILIIRRTLDRRNKVTDTKYSLSNDDSLVDSQKEDLAFRQAQRYWVRATVSKRYSF
ncbi:MAG: SRSO17 transposase [Arenicella sp.]